MGYRESAEDFINRVRRKVAIRQESIQKSVGFVERKHATLTDLYQDFAQTYTRKGECEISGMGTDHDPLVIRFPFPEDHEDHQVSSSQYRTETPAEFARLKAHLLKALSAMNTENTKIPQDITVIKEYFRILPNSGDRVLVSESEIIELK